MLFLSLENNFSFGKWQSHSLVVASLQSTHSLMWPPTAPSGKTPANMPPSTESTESRLFQSPVLGFSRTLELSSRELDEGTLFAESLKDIYCFNQILKAKSSTSQRKCLLLILLRTTYISFFMD
ncbi:hypothetical protein LEMLEM_LOCUS20612 [Lemmus lemmus]